MEMKKIVSVILIVLMLAAMLVSCQAPVDENGDGTLPPDVVPTGDVDTTDTDANQYQNDRLPSGADLEKLGFAGAEVKLLSWDKEEAQTFPKEDSTSDPIKSKLFYHWKSIEERFGITLKTDYTDSGWSENPKFLTDARADSARYDLMQTQTLYPITLAMEGRLVNLMPLGFPDLEMPWWPSSTSEYSQHGALFFLSSNSSIMSISNMAVIFVNTGLITAKGNADPVQSVLRGTWTIDEMTKISKSFAGEAANAAPESRIYGFVVDDGSRWDRFYFALGFSGVKNVNGVGTFGFDEESELQAISAAIDKMAPLMSGLGNEVLVHASDNATEMYQGRVAMFLGYMQYIRSLEDTEAYTVVPMPMLNDAQYDTLGYRTTHRDYADLWCMPTTTQNKVLSGMILEANASGEYRNVGPYYYEEYLKDRYANGTMGRECFDILRHSVVYDFGVAGNRAGIGISGWRGCFYPNYKNDFVTNYRKSATALNANLEEVLAAYEKYKNN